MKQDLKVNNDLMKKYVLRNKLYRHAGKKADEWVDLQIKNSELSENEIYGSDKLNELIKEASAKYNLNSLKEERKIARKKLRTDMIEKNEKSSKLEITNFINSL